MKEELPGLLRRDERLARLASGGNERAFSMLYERYRGPVYGYCISILRDQVDADDAVQSTFTHALDALRRGMRDAPLRPWLFRIAHNEAVSLIRRRKMEDVGFADLNRQLAAEHPGADREQFGALLADLHELPERQREAIVLRVLSGLSHGEIALALGTSVTGAKQAIFEARAALAEFEEGRAMACHDVRRLLTSGDRRVLRGRRVRAHLRDCAACAAFVQDMDSGPTRVRGFAPTLTGALLSRVFARLAGIGSRVEIAHTRLDGAAGSLADVVGASKALAGVLILSALATGGGLMATRSDGARGGPSRAPIVKAQTVRATDGARPRAAAPPLSLLEAPHGAAVGGAPVSGAGATPVAALMAVVARGSDTVSHLGSLATGASAVRAAALSPPQAPAPMVGAAGIQPAARNVTGSSNSQGDGSGAPGSDLPTTSARPSSTSNPEEPPVAASSRPAGGRGGAPGRGRPDGAGAEGGGADGTPSGLTTKGGGSTGAAAAGGGAAGNPPAAPPGHADALPPEAHGLGPPVHGPSATGAGRAGRR